MKILGKSLHFHLILVWVIPGTLVLLSSLLMITIWAKDKQNAAFQQLSSQTKSNALSIARRVSAELLIGDKGSPQVVLREQGRQYGLKDLLLLNGNPECANQDAHFCYVKEGETAFFYQKIPHLTASTYLQIKRPLPGLFEFLESRFVWISIVPLLVFIIMGIILQRVILARYIENPIADLVGVSTGAKDPKPYWPSELKSIGRKLSDTFEDRDKAIFGQLAKGVIHDIKTMIHSMMSATQLATEEPLSDSSKEQRLYLLLNSCSKNLPKMQRIIERTLDGSREIPIKKIPDDIRKTLDSVIETFQLYAQTRSIALRANYSVETAIVSHDKDQLSRAIGNVIQNSIDALEEDNIKDRSVNVFLGMNQNQVEISIEDSGAGFPFGDINSFRTMRSTKRHGSGLGLVISKKIIEGHHAKILLSKSSKLGGAKVSFVFPSQSQGST